MNNYRTALTLLGDERITQDAEEIETTLERIQALRDESAAASAISRSISHTEIVTLTPADGQEHDLLCEALDEVCDDSAAADGWTEYWGTDGDDHEWRVHVRLSEVAS